MLLLHTHSELSLTLELDEKLLLLNIQAASLLSLPRCRDRLFGNAIPLKVLHHVAESCPQARAAAVISNTAVVLSLLQRRRK
jgi:hypothetical protein